MMMIIDEFVLEKNPQKEEGDIRTKILSLLDDLYMDPLERELIRYNLETDILIKRDLPYRADLVKLKVVYHMENKHLPILVEVLSMDNIIMDKILDGFKAVMPEFDFVYYQPKIHGYFTNGLIGISKEYLNENKTKMDLFKEDYFMEKGTSDRVQTGKFRMNASLKLEYIGYEKIDDKMIVYCVIYDRKYNMHGYVAFNI